MKKSLFAIAAVGAFAGAAQAQSSVTVYGLLDYGYAGASQAQRGIGSSAAPTAATNIPYKMQNSGFAGDGESTSRLGFRGTEDLGGGTRAFFTAEAALAANPASNATTSITGTPGTATTNANGLFTSGNTGIRQLFIGVSQKGLGSASIGTQYTPIHEEVGATNAGGVNNQMGDVIYDRRGIGADIPASGMSTNDSYTVRINNSLVFKSERMSGVQAKAIVVNRGTTNNQQNSTLGGQNTTSGFGINLNAQVQKLYATASYQSFRTEVSATALNAGNTTLAPNGFSVGYNAGNWTNGTNSSDAQMYFAASYDFGILTGYVGYINRKVTNIMDSNNYVSRTAQQIGVRAPVTKTITSWASVGTGKINNGGTNDPTAKFVGWQIGSDYNLSKRTNLYAIYGTSSTSNSTTGAYSNPISQSAAVTSYNQSSYAVGVRHTF